MIFRCDCVAFARARRACFVVAADGRWHLADKTEGVAGTPGWARTYGPAIRHCPFCGRRLEPPATRAPV